MTVAGDLDRLFMARALALAERGLFTTSPNPRVGCVVARNGEAIGEGFHARAGGPHAETVALDAVRAGGADSRGATLYVTLEPCPMCAAAMAHARIARLVFGAWDPRQGAAGSAFNLVAAAAMNHRVDAFGGVLSEECGELLRRFFADRR